MNFNILCIIQYTLILPFYVSMRGLPSVSPQRPQAKERVEDHHNLQPGGGAIGIEGKTSVFPAAGPKLLCHGWDHNGFFGFSWIFKGFNHQQMDDIMV